MLEDSSEPQAIAASSSSTRPPADHKIAGLTRWMVAQGTSSRANVDFVCAPRPTGKVSGRPKPADASSDDVEWEELCWQCAGKSGGGACHYVVRATVPARRAVRGAGEVWASCSCPFAATDGWCKHCRACLLSAVDETADAGADPGADPEAAAAGDGAAAAASRAPPPRALPWLGGAHAESARPAARRAESADEPARSVRRKLAPAAAGSPAPAEPARWWEADQGGSASDESGDDGG